MKQTLSHYLGARTGALTAGTAARLTTLAVAVLLVGALGACTSTQRVGQVIPPPSNKAPTTGTELRVAETALQSGNIELASGMYQRILQANPRSVEATTGLGDTLYAVGDFTRAGVYYSKASALDPSAAAPLIGSARVAIRQRRLDDAIALYRQVLKLTPGDLHAQAGLGTALDMKGDHAGAQVVLRDALRQHPGEPVLNIDLGLSLTLGGNPREGANVLLDVTRFPEAPPQARADLALAYGLLGNKDAAAALLGQDLPQASVEDNLRFYEEARARLSPQTAGGVAPAAAAAPAAPRVAVTAIRTPDVVAAVAATNAATTAAASSRAQQLRRVPVPAPAATADADTDLPMLMQQRLTDH